MGLALMVIIWLITLGSTWFFVKPLYTACTADPHSTCQWAMRWWMPQGFSAAAPGIDRQFTATFIAMGVVFILAQFGLGYFAWRYRERNRAAKAGYSHGNTKFEILWTALTAVLFIGLNLSGSSIWARERFQPVGANDLGAPVPVEVTGMQFAWYFRYPGPDGVFGPTDITKSDPSAGNEDAIGLLKSDPASKDDVVVTTMYLPVGREVDLRLRSVDVIHSFFVPSFRFKQDAVPGLDIHMHFTPTQIGDYEIACAELCGLGHYKMHGVVKVLSQGDFDQWLAEREKEKQQ